MGGRCDQRGGDGKAGERGDFAAARGGRADEKTVRRLGQSAVLLVHIQAGRATRRMQRRAARPRTESYLLTYRLLTVSASQTSACGLPRLYRAMRRFLGRDFL